MTQPVPTALMGTLLALCAVAASDASAQSGPIVLNEQIQFGDIFAGQQLNVVVARQQVTVTNTALGNQLAGGAEERDVSVQNRQYQHGTTSAEVSLYIGDEAAGRVTAVNQARANEASIAANGAELVLDSDQANYGSAIARTVLGNTEAHLTGGISLSSAAYSNAMTAGGKNAVTTGAISQSTSGSTVAETYAPARYVPGAAYYASDAAANLTQLTTTGSSAQRVEVGQVSEGWTSAETVATAANAWNSVATSSAAANRINASNAGGSQVVTTRQSNIGGVQSQASTYAYDYGDLRAVADGVANQVSVSNQDVWVEIDNSQFNSGGVSVQAELTAHNGYEAYVGTNAAGNSVTGYACSDCGGILNANTTQTNHGNVSATAVTNIGGQGRAVITGTTATGNTASFYVTRPGD